MPELQTSTAQGAALPPLTLDAMVGALADADYAFGCECADPTLQIERWEESRPTPEAN